MTDGVNRHVDDVELEQYSMGKLPEIETDGIEEHLLVCEHCQQRMQETDTYVTSMKSAAAEFRQGQRLVEVAPQPRHWTWFRMAAGLAAGVVLYILIGSWSGTSDTVGVPPFAISLEATRGAADAAWAPANTPLMARLDLAGLPDLPSYGLEVVDATGGVVWQGTAKPKDTKVESKIPQTKAGMHFIRVYSPAGELLREFGLQTR